MKKTTKMVYMSLLIAMALILFIFEAMIPIPFITPGAKLGLANLVIMIAVYTLDSYKESFTVLLIRILLSTFFAGSASTLIYSISGGVLSFIVTIIVKELGGKYVSIIGVSAAAAVFHNIGQLLVASLILNNFGVMLYLPILSLAGIGTGIFVGISANYLVAHLNKILYFK
ncbi:Gx transporter family protein [Clostridium mediterraneense]|uniref:Gx transporter family protein n=1 Tax=Clostridium mediterraneense TaxID=1805472 RepID=UPI0008296187|nr:Gx transporter family protein [Clostridium mediterraneense]